MSGPSISQYTSEGLRNMASPAPALRMRRLFGTPTATSKPAASNEHEPDENNSPSASPSKRLTREERLALQAKKDKNHTRYVERTYALAPGEYDAMLKRQGGRCAICRKVPRKRYLAVDHDHTTGRVRGLLCFFCNSALGVWEFDPDVARRAADYLFDIAQRSVVQPTAPVTRVPDDLPF
jgi:hypothetical protein